MSPWYVLAVWIAASIAMFFGWLIQLRTRNAGIVDAIWSFGMGASALYYAWISSGGLVARWAVALLGSLWGFRLCLHILARVLNEPEDGRYKYLREYWQGDQRKFFAFFMAQGLLTALFSLPFYAVAQAVFAPMSEFSVWRGDSSLAQVVPDDPAPDQNQGHGEAPHDQPVRRVLGQPRPDLSADDHAHGQGRGSPHPAVAERPLGQMRRGPDRRRDREHKV